MRVTGMLHYVSVTLALTTWSFLGSCPTSAMVGGWRKQDAEKNIKYLPFAYYAVATQTQGLKNYNTVVRLLEVKTQVVAGINYKLVFTTAPTNCVVGKVLYSPHVCTPVGHEDALCSATIYAVPWMKQMSVTSYKCSSIKLSQHPI
ncbi:cystatin-1-like [Rhipicephalus sanguineus]|uniref:cystatin-1-like n=1 Tax=Rhipicephalus sanguineus TaxID=34632 RepID=UPI0020C1E6CF|nr:cystatin-1-like [Rhipicephalus sanguineus]